MSEVSWNPEIRCERGKWMGLLPDTERQIRELITAVVRAPIDEYDDFLVALQEAWETDSSCVTRMITRSAWGPSVDTRRREGSGARQSGIDRRNAIRTVRESAGQTPDQRNSCAS